MGVLRLCSIDLKIAMELTQIPTNLKLPWDQVAVNRNAKIWLLTDRGSKRVLLMIIRMGLTGKYRYQRHKCVRVFI